jgi:hypothetical protein
MDADPDRMIREMKWSHGYPEESLAVIRTPEWAG